MSFKLLAKFKKKLPNLKIVSKIVGVFVSRKCINLLIYTPSI